VKGNSEYENNPFQYDLIKGIYTVQIHNIVEYRKNEYTAESGDDSAHSPCKGNAANNDRCNGFTENLGTRFSISHDYLTTVIL